MNVAAVVGADDLVDEPVDRLMLGDGLASVGVPAAVEGVEGNPLEDEDVVTPVDEIDREEVRCAVTEVLRDLSARERKILDWRFGLETGDGDSVTLGEIGKRLGISRERVRQIECAALARLRRAPSMRRLRGSLSWLPEAVEK